jgi:hypothetical protein
MEIQKINIYYKIYIIRRKQKGKEKWIKNNDKKRIRRKNCGNKMTLSGVRTYEYKTLIVTNIPTYQQSHNGNTQTSP